jgi:CubicO group peptidase (beta-lactamase class C family)
MKVTNALSLILILLLSSCAKNQTIDFTSFGVNSLKETSHTGSTLSDRMAHYDVPGVSISVVVNGEIKWARGYGISNTISGKKVQATTLFQAGSISKPLAALSALKLMQEGKIDIDEDVNTYLTDWKFPENTLTEDVKVTLRRLLTHTAGVTVHGFPGYKQTDAFPSIQAVLDGEGNTPAIYADTIPGTIWRYSGGGYTVVEKLVEDISGLPFEEYMTQNIFKPIGMENSTFQQPLPPDLHSEASAAYDAKGRIIEGLWHNYPEQAAAGLWTTPMDLAKYCIEIQEILLGKSSGVLSKETVEMMLIKHKNNWGLGPSLEKEGNSLVFRHGGKNAGFTNTMISFAYQRKAVIVMTNGDNGRQLIDEIINSIFLHYRW